MGLQAAVLAGVEAARQALGDLLIKTEFKRRVKNAYVPGQPVSYTETTYTIDGAVVQWDYKELQGSVVESSDLKFIAFKFDTYPAINDTVEIDGIVYRVYQPNPIMAGNVIAITIIHLKPLAATP